MTLRRLLAGASVVVGAALVVWGLQGPMLGGPAVEPPKPPAPPPVSVAPRPPPAAAPPAAAPVVPRSSEVSPSVRAIHALEPELVAFVGRSLVLDLREGTSAEEENERIIEGLAKHAAEARRLEDAYGEVMARGEDPKATVLALLAFGDLKDAMGVDLEEASIPSWLIEERAELYRAEMATRADASFASARDAWDRAATFARRLPPDPEIEALLADRR